MKFNCVTTDSGGCDCFVEFRKLIASASDDMPYKHMCRMDEIL